MRLAICSPPIDHEASDAAVGGVHNEIVAEGDASSSAIAGDISLVLTVRALLRK